MEPASPRTSVGYLLKENCAGFSALELTFVVK